MRRAVILVAAVACAALYAGAARAGSENLTEVVVTLDAPPLARAVQMSRVLTARTKAERLDLRSVSSRDYVRRLASAQRALASRIVRTLPGARVTWRYRVVLNGIAVLLPRSELGRLSSVSGVAAVWPNVTYRARLDRSPRLIGADQMWSAPEFTTAGNGVKIGIIDDGVDQAHPFFDPTGYTMPPGFPKGDAAYTTAKVIVARAFSPPTNTWKYGTAPFDPVDSEHATHVAGIAAGDYRPNAIPGRGPLSGVAPNAYLGNYKVLTVPTANFGLNGNAPEIAAGIEAAVADGMDVINLSLGEPEIEPSRDLVVAAIDGAADAGVVPVVAAGNDFQDFGRGSIDSPGSAPAAITAAAVSKQLVVAGFSSSGPTPISLQMKPDVSAPGVDITSSVPPRFGSWASLSGTSMATPHVAGAVALLRQRHPDWTVQQIKSALVSTGRPVVLSVGGPEAPASREGGGLIYVPSANDPKIFTSPASLSFGLLRTGANATGTVQVTDAGGGAGRWTVAVAAQSTPTGVTVSAPPTLTVPGALVVSVSADPAAAQGNATGFVTLTNGVVSRRVPYWFHVEAPMLARDPHGTLTKPGVFAGQTKGRPGQVSTYRYPDAPQGVPRVLPGPEQVFRVVLKQPVANFGVVVVSSDPGVSPSPRVVRAGDENRLVGNPGLPLVINPYLDAFGTALPVAAAIRPAPGAYDIVFDTPAGTRPGAFTFRFWINDNAPPTVRLLTPAVVPPETVNLAIADRGSGVLPSSLTATIDGKQAAVSYADRRAKVTVPAAVTPGRHRLELSVSDYQELKNMEDVPKILPNTRVFQATVVVR